MSEPLNIVLIIVVLFGLAGSLFPSLPGAGIILIGALLHGVLTGFDPLSLQLIMVLAAICLLGYLGQYLITGVAGKKMGASKEGILGACLGMLAGLILPIPGGIFIGAFLGAVSFEIVFDYKELHQAMKSGTGALIGVALSLFFEFTVGLIMAVIIFYQLVKTGT